MLKGSLIVSGAVIFVLGLLLRSDLAVTLLRAVGWLAIIAGAIIFAWGVFSAVRTRR